MALQTIKGGLWIPLQPIFDASVPVFSTALTIDASTEKAAHIFRVPKTGTLDKFEFQCGAVTFNAASVLRASFQDVDLTNGSPDGTQDQFRDMTTLTANGWNVPGLLTSDGTDGGVKRSITRGDLLACVLQYQTFTAADSVIVSSLPHVQTRSTTIGLCYANLFTASWAHQQNAMCFALKYNDGTYEFIQGVHPASPLNTTTFNNTSTPDERGMIFQLPFPCQVYGIWFRCDLDAVADLVLYDSDGSTALQTVSLDPDVRISTVGTTFTVSFASSQTLNANTNYRVVLKPTSTSNVSLYDFDVNAAAILDAVEGGQNFHYTERTDAGAWTQTTTKRPWMGLLVSALDDGVAAAGSPIFGGMVIH